MNVRFIMYANYISMMKNWKYTSITLYNIKKNVFYSISHFIIDYFGYMSREFVTVIYMPAHGFE